MPLPAAAVWRSHAHFFIVRDANGQALMKTNPVAAQRLSCSGDLTSFEGDPLQSF
jgi:hypothetical protein